MSVSDYKVNREYDKFKADPNDDTAVNVTTAYNTSFLVEVSKGNVPGHSIVTYFGVNKNVTTPEETIWIDSTLYTWRTIAGILTVSSTSASDTLAGTGLRTVRVDGLDADYNEISEIVTLNGLTAVSTVNSYLRVNKLTGLSAGSADRNAGIVYIGDGVVTAGKPANVTNVIDIGANLSHSAFFTVPAGKSGHIVQTNYSGQSGKVMELFAYHRDFGGLFLQTDSLNLSDSNIATPSQVPQEIILEKSDFEYRGNIDTQSGIIKVTMSVLIIDN